MMRLVTLIFLMITFVLINVHKRHIEELEKRMTILEEKVHE